MNVTKIVIVSEPSQRERNIREEIKIWFKDSLKHNVIDAAGAWHNFDAAQRASRSGVSVTFEGAEIEWDQLVPPIKESFALAIGVGFPRSEIFPAIRDGLKDTELSQSTPWFSMYIDHLETVYDKTLEEFESAKKP